MKEVEPEDRPPAPRGDEAPPADDDKAAGPVERSIPLLPPD